MGENGKVSVIIPIYNGEKYISDCIESIRNQTYNNIEILLINDGSTDSTQQICENYEKEDNRIKLYNNKNSGVSYSRNFGINKATGEYILFVDCDDFIENNMIEVIVNKIHEFDYVAVNYKKYYSEEKIVRNVKVTDCEYNKQSFLGDFWNLYNCNIINSPCNKIFKTSVIKENNIKFRVEYNLGEDLIFNLEYIQFCEKFCVMNQYLYNYRYKLNSLTTTFRKDKIYVQIELNNKIKKFLIMNNHYFEQDKKEFEKNIANIIICNIQELFVKENNLNNTQVKEILKEYLSIQEIKKLKDVKYDEKRLQIFKVMIEKKCISTIIIYSRIKEFLKKIYRK